MTLHIFGKMVLLVIEFFSYETIWAASSTLKMIYWLKTLLMGGAVAMASVLIAAAVQWPRGGEVQVAQKYHPNDTGEERLVMQGEFRSTQERNREVQSEMREAINATRAEVAAMRKKQDGFDAFQARIEEKLNIWTTVMGIGFSAVITQLIAYLLNMRLRKDQRAHEDVALRKMVSMLRKSGVVFPATEEVE